MLRNPGKTLTLIKYDKKMEILDPKIPQGHWSQKNFGFARKRFKFQKQKRVIGQI